MRDPKGALSVADLTIMSPVRDYVTAHPTAKEVFRTNGLDWERDLDRPLEIACTSQGVDLSLLLMDLLEVTAARATSHSTN